VPAATARRLYLATQGLLDDPTRRATTATVRTAIRRLGYVQIDSINIVERAHHLILASRFDRYEPSLLHRLLESGRLFEHWTHDASAIPVEWYRYWRIRFERYRPRHRVLEWWQQRFETEPQVVFDHVVGRIREEGPLRSADFEHDRGGKSQGWWDWKPQKAALEVLWRNGTLAIARRDGFQKVYDLSERVLPKVVTDDPPDDDEHVDWACRSALQRLVIATPGEIKAYLNAVSPAATQAWCKAAIADGRVMPVEVASADGGPAWRAVALPDWRARARRLADAPKRARLLCPFDPIVRDRRRALRLFGFDYRFEAFVPAPKRRYGYYVLPILEGDRIIGRLDPKLHRDRGVLEVKGVWWEPNVRPTPTRRRAVRAAVDRLARFVGADDVATPSGL
jgi:uncharacterized protein YcaQ